MSKIPTMNFNLKKKDYAKANLNCCLFIINFQVLGEVESGNLCVKIGVEQCGKQDNSRI